MFGDNISFPLLVLLSIDLSDITLAEGDSEQILKAINRKNNEGTRLRCRECKSYRHMREECKDKGKEEIMKHPNGETMRCSSCDSIKHLLPACQHSWNYMVNFGEGENSEEELLVGWRER